MSAAVDRWLAAQPPIDWPTVIVLGVAALCLWALYGLLSHHETRDRAASLILDLENDRESAPSSAEVDDAQPEAPQAHHAPAAAEVRELPARGDGRYAVAGRTQARRSAGRYTLDREHRPIAHVLPVVPEALQPGGGREAGRRDDEPGQGQLEAAGPRAEALGLAEAFYPNAVRDVAVMLATKQYTGTAWRDDDVWHEELTDDERDDHEETARAILATLAEESRE